MPLELSDPVESHEKLREIISKWPGNSLHGHPTWLFLLQASMTAMMFHQKATRRVLFMCSTIGRCLYLTGWEIIASTPLRTC